jgi:carboxyl-terminal processing protease
MYEMMNHLDPHSVYIPAMDVGEANEDIIGNFEGIGVEFNIFEDTVHVLYVVPNGPSDKAGLQIGDRILKVNDSSVVSKTLPSASIRRMIRGEAGSKVKLTILRANTIQYYYVQRGTIPIPSMDAAYMLDSATGYIKLNKFSETTYRDFMGAVDALKARNMKGMILDLRGNGGGLVNQAVNIADEFLDGDKLIVYTEGTNTPKREYRAGKEGVWEKGKLTVLVDELSASASEILAGALQDWDRATIVGRRSFGKGLVQEQYSLSDGSAIRLTVRGTLPRWAAAYSVLMIRVRNCIWKKFWSATTTAKCSPQIPYNRIRNRPLLPRMERRCTAVAALCPMCLYLLIPAFTPAPSPSCTSMGASTTLCTSTTSTTCRFSRSINHRQNSI